MLSEKPLLLSEECDEDFFLSNLMENGEKINMGKKRQHIYIIALKIMRTHQSL